MRVFQCAIQLILIVLHEWNFYLVPIYSPFSRWKPVIKRPDFPPFDHNFPHCWGVLKIAPFLFPDARIFTHVQYLAWKFIEHKKISRVSKSINSPVHREKTVWCDWKFVSSVRKEKHRNKQIPLGVVVWAQVQLPGYPHNTVLSHFQLKAFSHTFACFTPWGVSSIFLSGFLAYNELLTLPSDCKQNINKPVRWETDRQTATGTWTEDSRKQHTSPWRMRMIRCGYRQRTSLSCFAFILQECQDFVHIHITWHRVYGSCIDHRDMHACFTVQTTGYHMVHRCL